MGDGRLTQSNGWLLLDEMKILLPGVMLNDEKTGYGFLEDNCVSD